MQGSYQGNPQRITRRGRGLQGGLRRPKALLKTDRAAVGVGIHSDQLEIRVSKWQIPAEMPKFSGVRCPRPMKPRDPPIDARESEMS